MKLWLMTWRVWCLLLSVIVCFGPPNWEAYGKAPLEASAAGQWYLLTTGELANLHVERALFEHENSRYFFIHVRITNISQQVIGVDLHDYWNVIHPNQWGVQEEDHRGVVNEGRMMLKPLDDQQKQQIIADYHAKNLTMIAPGQTTDYYRVSSQWE